MALKRFMSSNIIVEAIPSILSPRVKQKIFYPLLKRLESSARRKDSQTKTGDNRYIKKLDNRKGKYKSVSNFTNNVS